MYHVVVRDRRAARCPRRSPTTSTIIAARSTTTWCSRTTSPPARNAPSFTLEASGHRHAARCALRLRAHGARALRRHGLGERPHRASHVRLRAEHAGRRAANGCAAAASTSGRKRVTYPIIDRWYAKGHDQFHKDGEGEGLDLYSIGGSRGAGGTGVWDGTKLWTSDNFVERAGAVERAAARGVQAHLRALGCRRAPARSQRPNNSPSIAAATSTRWRACSISPGNEAVVGIGITEHPAVRRFPRGRAHARPARPLDELLGGEQGRRARHRGDPRRRRDTRPALRTRSARRSKGNGNHLLLVKARDGVPLRYLHRRRLERRAGSSTDRAAWERYVKEFAARAAKPLTITVSARPVKARQLSRALWRCWLSASAAFAQNKYFADWPAGTDPREVGKRVAERFIPDAAHGDAAATARRRCTTRTWPRGPARCSSRSLTKDEDLEKRLVDRFDPFLTANANARAARRSRGRHGVRRAAARALPAGARAFVIA